MTGIKLLLARWAFSLLFAAVGVYMSRAARRVFLLQREWGKKGIVALGEIVGFESKSPTNEPARRKFFAPVVTFTAQNGDSIRFTSATSLRPNPYVVGQRVTVRYLSDDPDTADLESVTSSWWPFIALLVLILVAFTIAALPFLLGPPVPRS